ncbi:hypothetical protein VIN01S_22740 [Vibrio inusitatus NBRC 102082]|uniref:Histidinol-phosphatase n=1 Tax=Vibrio inusitatus NBRC 102082 TaxID=1219070 RepID=A0A4Y3HXN1_9VIBR|nr:hypothetical protein [Vibrio inusitatus]GEA51470.1 hypothetical protein VIN01S_22740 [Vibrio inusitatus NBRC 102082]
MGCKSSSDDNQITDKPALPILPEQPGPLPPELKPELKQGRFYAGDFHVHTAISEDAHTPVNEGLRRTFEVYDLDFAFISDHLRLTHRDDQNIQHETPLPVFDAIQKYQLQHFDQYLKDGKLLIAGTEWNNDNFEHTNIWMFDDAPNSPNSINFMRQFEFYAQDYDESYYDQEEVLKWLEEGERFDTSEGGLDAIKWLKTNIPQGQGLIQFNHPNRKGDNYTVSDYRDILNTAPGLMCAYEGLPGNQRTDLRAEYEYDKYNGNIRAFVYGGVDYSVNELGGEWDALLAEGHKIYLTSNSDFHDAYAPGEYNKTLVWLDDDQEFSIANIMQAVCSGKTVAMYGNLIEDLMYFGESSVDKQMMGDTLFVTKGDDVELTLRFKPSEGNPYTEEHNLEAPTVDHIDLIGGEMVERSQPGTPEYELAFNHTTRLHHRFMMDEFTLDDDGYYTLTYTVKDATKDMYFRVRGTNIELNSERMDRDGNPNVDFRRASGQSSADNYNSLWFYSSPIYLNVE